MQQSLSRKLKTCLVEISVETKLFADLRQTSSCPMSPEETYQYCFAPTLEMIILSNITPDFYKHNII